MQQRIAEIEEPAGAADLRNRFQRNNKSHLVKLGNEIIRIIPRTLHN